MTVMDNTTEIKRSLLSLLHIALNLFRMAGFQGDRRIEPIARGERSMPRKLYHAVMAILVPAEAATRRLIIAMAKGINAPLPALRLHTMPSAETASPLPAHDTADLEPAGGVDRPRRSPEISIPHFRLFDPPLPKPRPYQPPRIPVPDDRARGSTPSPRPANTIDAARLVRRLAALNDALCNMKDEAQRYARWQARQNARRQAGLGFIPALRLNGSLPGGRLQTYSDYLRRARKTNIRDIDEVLVLADLYAEQAILFPDTS